MTDPAEWLDPRSAGFVFGLCVLVGIAAYMWMLHRGWLSVPESGEDGE